MIVGTNVNGPKSYSSGQQFLNIFKTADGGWNTLDSSNLGTNEVPLLYSTYLDANGYPLALSTSDTRGSGTVTGSISANTTNGTVMNVSATLTGTGPAIGLQVTGTGISNTTYVNRNLGSGNWQVWCMVATTGAPGSNISITVGTATVTGYVNNYKNADGENYVSALYVSSTTGSAAVGSVVTGSGLPSNVKLLEAISAGESNVFKKVYVDFSTVSETLTFSGAHSFSRVSTRLLDIPTSTNGYSYKKGNYVLLYDGVGSVTAGQTFSINNTGWTVLGETAHDGTAGTGRVVLTAASNATYIDIILIACTVGNNPKNFRFYYAPTSTLNTPDAAYESPTETFNPDFISMMTPYKMVRFWPWGNVYGGTAVNYSDLTPVGWFSWCDSNLTQGNVPFDVQIALCNKLGAHPYLVLPLNLSDAAVTTLAGYVLNGFPGGWSGLNSTLNCYVEFGNELWNTINGAGVTAFTKTASSYIAYSGQAAYHGYGLIRQFQTTKIFKDTFTSGAQGSRLYRIFTDQLANSGAISDSLNKKWSDFAIVGGGPPGAQWTGPLGGTSPNWNFDVFTGGGYLNNEYYGFVMGWPAAWTADFPSAYTKMKTQMLQGAAGNIIPKSDNTNATTVTASDGTALPAGWTACKVAASLPHTPPVNGDVIAVHFPQNAGAAATIITNDSSTPHALRGMKGEALSGFPGPSDGYAGYWVLCYTDTTSSGSAGTNAGWWLVPPYNSQPTGQPDEVLGWVTNALAVTSTFGMPNMIFYESGQQMQVDGNNGIIQDLNVRFQSQQEMYDVYYGSASSFLEKCSANGNVVYFNHYYDCGYYRVSDNTPKDTYGATDNVLDLTMPKQRALTDFSNSQGHHGGKSLKNAF